MKYIVINIIFVYCLLSAISINAQTPLYTFLDGWRGDGLVEKEGFYFTFSNHQYSTINGQESAIVVNKIDSASNIVDSWIIKNDSAKLEDANPLGYGILSSFNGQNWLGSNYNVYQNGNSYTSINKFNTELSSLDTSILIPTNSSTVENGSLINLKVINDSSIIICSRMFSLNQGIYIYKGSKNRYIR